MSMPPISSSPQRNGGPAAAGIDGDSGPDGGGGGSGSGSKPPPLEASVLSTQQHRHRKRACQEARSACSGNGLNASRLASSVAPMATQWNATAARAKWTRFHGLPEKSQSR